MACSQCRQLGFLRGCLPHIQKQKKVEASLRDAEGVSSKAHDISGNQSEILNVVRDAEFVLEHMAAALDDLAHTEAPTMTEDKRVEVSQLKEGVELLSSRVEESGQQLQDNPADSDAIEMLRDSLEQLQQAGQMAIADQECRFCGLSFTRREVKHHEHHECEFRKRPCARGCGMSLTRKQRKMHLCRGRRTAGDASYYVDDSQDQMDLTMDTAEDDSEMASPLAKRVSFGDVSVQDTEESSAADEEAEGEEQPDIDPSDSTRTIYCDICQDILHLKGGEDKEMHMMRHADVEAARLTIEDARPTVESLGLQVEEREEGGVALGSVREGRSAAVAGLTEGDVITSWGEQEITCANDLSEAVAATSKTDGAVQVVVKRNDDVESVTVVFPRGTADVEELGRAEEMLFQFDRDVEAMRASESLEDLEKEFVNEVAAVEQRTQAWTVATSGEEAPAVGSGHTTDDNDDDAAAPEGSDVAVPAILTPEEELQKEVKALRAQIKTERGVRERWEARVGVLQGEVSALEIKREQYQHERQTQLKQERRDAKKRDRDTVFFSNETGMQEIDKKEIMKNFGVLGEMQDQLGADDSASDSEMSPSPKPKSIGALARLRGKASVGRKRSLIEMARAVSDGIKAAKSSGQNAFHSTGGKHGGMTLAEALAKRTRLEKELAVERDHYEFQAENAEKRKSELEECYEKLKVYTGHSTPVSPPKKLRRVHEDGADDEDVRHSDEYTASEASDNEKENFVSPARNIWRRCHTNIETMTVLMNQAQKQVSADNRSKLRLEEEEFVEAVMSRLGLEKFRTGEYIVEEGEEGTCMYIVAEGVCRVELVAGKTIPIKQGGFFGEIALLGDGRRSASVAAEQTCELFTLERDDCLEILSDYPEKEAYFRAVAEAKLNRDRNVLLGGKVVRPEIPLWVSLLARTCCKRYREAKKRRMMDSSIEAQLQQMEREDDDSEEELVNHVNPDGVKKKKKKKKAAMKTPMTSYRLRMACRQCGKEHCPEYRSGSSENETRCVACGCAASSHPVITHEIPRTEKPPIGWNTNPRIKEDFTPITLPRRIQAKPKRKPSYFDQIQAARTGRSLYVDDELDEEEINTHMTLVDSHLQDHGPAVDLNLHDVSSDDGEVQYDIDLTT